MELVQTTFYTSENRGAFELSTHTSWKRAGKVSAYEFLEAIWLDELKAKVLWFFIPEPPALPEEGE